MKTLKEKINDSVIDTFVEMAILDRKRIKLKWWQIWKY